MAPNPADIIPLFVIHDDPIALKMVAVWDMVTGKRGLDEEVYRRWATLAGVSYEDAAERAPQLQALKLCPRRGRTQADIPEALWRLMLARFSGPEPKGGGLKAGMRVLPGGEE